MLLSIAGGLLIGLSALMVFAILGRIAGISGMFWQLLRQPKRSLLHGDWRLFFILGLICGPLILVVAGQHSAPNVSDSNALALVAGAFFVGFGTRLGSGCTSGHGVCGIARMSWRSITATLVFMFSGMAVVTLLKPFL